MDGWDWGEIDVHTGEFWLLLICLALLLLGLAAGYAIGFDRGRKTEREREAHWVDREPPPPNVGGTYIE